MGGRVHLERSEIIHLERSEIIHLERSEIIHLERFCLLILPARDTLTSCVVSK